MQACKILLADDDPDDRSIIMDAMEVMNAGGWMKFAENGQKVLDILEEEFGADNTPQLIVLDLNMPKMNGKQTLTFLKSNERYAQIPAVIYSTYTDATLVIDCKNLGAEMVSNKPIDHEGYQKMMDDFLQIVN